MLLSILIVSYNTSDFTLKAAESVLAETETSELLRNQTELLIIDNNSSDDTVEKVSELQPKHTKLHLLTNNTNLGFAGANNRGIKRAKGQYILLLNSDTIVKAPALSLLVEAFEQAPNRITTSVLSSYHGDLDRLGILAATLLNPDDSLQPQGGSRPTLLSVAAQMFFLDDLPLIGQLFQSTQHTGMSQSQQQTQSSHLISKDWVAGTAMMIRQRVLKEVGPLDENFFMYGEDVEFCMRAQNHHWDVAIHPQAFITHLGSGSSSSAHAIKGEFEGLLYIWSKHKPLWQQSLIKLILKTGSLLRSVLFGTIIRQPDKAKVYQELFHHL